MRNAMISLRFSLIVTLLAGCYVGCLARRRAAPDEDTRQCPSITVTRKSIIRTRASIANGARLLHKTEVGSAKQCYFMCCQRDECDTAIMHYLHSDPGKMCYMFNCGNPSVCSFVPHESYAVIRLLADGHKDEQTGKPVTLPLSLTTDIKTSAPKREKTTSLPEEVCPEGSPVAMCAADPCSVSTCPAFPSAKCRPSFCGGCYAHYFDANMHRVQCQAEKTNTKVAKESKVTKKASNVETIDANSKVNEDLVVVSSADGGGLPTEDPNFRGEDPYAVKEYREWLDEPKKGEKKGKPQGTKDPRDFLFTNSTDKDRHMLPKGVQPTKVTTVVVSRFSFSLPLLLAMLICIVILTAVVWRMRCTKLGKKGKKFAVDDGDYLINGMYL